MWTALNACDRASTRLSIPPAGGARNTVKKSGSAAKHRGRSLAYVSDRNMASIEVNGARLDYVERGSGDPVVLVHGSASDRRTWDGQLAALGRSFRVVAYSRRYHWPNQSIARGSDYSMPEHVADLASLMQALELSPAHLVGHSYGGFVCLLLAMLKPASVRSLVLIEAPVFPLVLRIPPRPRDILRLFVTRPGIALDVAKFGALGLGPAIAATARGDRDEALRLLGSTILGSEPFRRLSDERLAQARANLIDAELLGSLFPPLTANQVRAVRCPVLLLSGDRSPVVLSHLTNVLRRLLPDVKRVDIAGASHLVHEDQPAAFASAVASFLDGHRQTTA
jgi:pimeloyl-ACP methyl ester carboxylesterase